MSIERTEVLDGEFVEDEDTRAGVVPRSSGATARHQTVHVITNLAAGDRAQRVRHGIAQLPTRAARLGYVLAAGWVSWTRRGWNGVTHGTIREQIRLARVAGDLELLAEWADRLDSAKTTRMRRLLDLPKALLATLLVIAVVSVMLGIGALAGGIAVWVSDEGITWGGWWSGLGDKLNAVGRALQLLTWAALWFGLPVVLVCAYREGRRVTDPPVWLLTAEERAVIGSEITPSKVVLALRDLGIGPLRTAILEAGDAGAGMLSPIKIAGCGVEVDVLLPSGVTTKEVAAKRRRLAENLDRHEHEVFPTVAVAARTLRLWIADAGALDQPIGPSPLVVDESLTADVYTGRAPWGQDLRGDAAALSLHQRHVLVTGLSNQGKTAALRALALWALLDPTAELRVADLKGIGDWHMLDGLATVLIEGPSDEHVIAATEMLEALVAEMERRLSALDPTEHPNGVTRDLARKKGSGFHPLFGIVDEAQQAFMCPAVGEDRRPYGGTKATSRYFNAARKLHNQGRAVNVLLWQGTQDPTDQNLPKLIREGAHVRASLAVGTEEQARMALGAKAIDGGAAPHLLRQGLDKGTVVVTGDGVKLAPGQASITVRTHYIDGEAATALARRAAELRGRTGRTYTAEPAAEALTDLDHLTAIRRNFAEGEVRVGTTEVLQRLAQDDPTVYEGAWDHRRLRGLLDRCGVPDRPYGGRKVVRAIELDEAIEGLLAEQDDDSTDNEEV